MVIYACYRQPSKNFFLQHWRTHMARSGLLLEWQLHQLPTGTGLKNGLVWWTIWFDSLMTAQMSTKVLKYPYTFICKASLRCVLYLCIGVTNTDITFLDSAWSIAMLSFICWWPWRCPIAAFGASSFPCSLRNCYFPRSKFFHCQLVICEVNMCALHEK